MENLPIGAIVGEFNATDPDVNSTATFSLVAGEGSDHNQYFSLTPDGILTTAEIFDLSDYSTRNLRVRASDEHDAGFEKAFVIDITSEPVVAFHPNILNLTAKQRLGTKLVDISYDLEWDANKTLSVEIWFADDDDFVFDVPCYTVSGDVGSGIAAGNGKSIVWDAGVDWDDSYSPRGRIKLILTYGEGQQASSGNP